MIDINAAIVEIGRILRNKKMWMRLILTLLTVGFAAWLVFSPKDIPTPWGTCHQGQVKGVTR